MRLMWNRVRILFACAICLGAALLCRRPPETDTPKVYDVYCRGVMAADPNEKVRWLSVAIHLDPNLARIYKDRARGYLELEDLDRAIRDSSKAIELKPDYAEAYNVRAIAYYLMQNHSKARADTDTCLMLGGEPHPSLLGVDRQRRSSP